MDSDRTTPAVPEAQSQILEDATAQPETTQLETLSPGAGNTSGDPNNNSAAERVVHPTAAGPVSEGHPSQRRPRHNLSAGFERFSVLSPHHSRDGHVRMSQRRRTLASTTGPLVASQDVSGIDWIVPVEEKVTTRRTVGERLQPVIENAIAERKKYAQRALWTGYALNIAIGLQVFLGALTTGLAAALTSPKQAQISTAILGGLSTLVASYLARARGSGEPESSVTREKDLEQFLRECRAFYIDHGHEYGTPENGLDYRLDSMRRRFEELLGNINGYVMVEGPGILPPS